MFYFPKITNFEVSKKRSESNWRDIVTFFNKVRKFLKSRTGHNLKPAFKPEKNYTNFVFSN